MYGGIVTNICLLKYIEENNLNIDDFLYCLLNLASLTICKDASVSWSPKSFHKIIKAFEISKTVS